MARKIQISFKELTVGDAFIVLDYQGSPEQVRIDVVDSDPGVFQVLSTDDVPQDNKLEVAMSRVEAALQDSQFVTDVNYEGTVMTIGLSDAFNNRLTLSSIGFRFISLTVAATDERLDKNNEISGAEDYTGKFSDPYIENIRIDEVKHQIIDFSGYAERTTNLAANFGNEVLTTITFTSADTLFVGDSIKFYYGYVEKDTTVYSSPGNYEINKDLFKDPYHESVTQFVFQRTGNTSTDESMNHVSPKWGQYGTATIQDTGADDQYILKFTHYVPFLPREDDYDVNNYFIPDSVNGGKTLKPIFQLDIIQDEASNAPEQSTNRIDLSNFFDKASIGYYDQVFQTGKDLYNLESYTFNNGSTDVSKIDSSRDTTLTFSISGDENFTTDAEIILHVIDLDLNSSEAAKRSNYTTNQNYDRVLVQANNTPSSSTRITNFKVERDALDLSLLNCTATIPKLKVTGFYAIWVSVSKNNSTLSAQNLYLQSEVAESGGDDTVIKMDFYNLQAQTPYFNFFPHWQGNADNITGAFNHVKGSYEDVYACLFRIVNEDAANTILQTFTVSIKSRTTNQVIESVKFNIEDGETISRNYNIPQEHQNKISFTPNYGFEAGKDEYLVNYAFQIGDDWYNIDNIVIEWNAIYEQTLDDGDVVTFNVWRQSKDFEINPYDQTQNIETEPQTLSVGDPEFYDASTGKKLSKISQTSGTKTLVKFTFEDNNLDDLQAIPTTPEDYIFLLANKQDGNLTGYINIVPEGGNESKRYRFHNFEENNTTFWEEPTGHVDTNKAKLRRVTTKQATIEAVIDADDLINTFGDDVKCYNISARIDKVQTKQALLDVDTDIYLIVDTTSFLDENSAGVAESRVNNWFLNYVRQARLAGQDFTGNLYKIYPQGDSFSDLSNFHFCERFLCYISALWENEEPADMTNFTGLPAGSDLAYMRRQSYIPGLITVMKSSDIDKNGINTTEIHDDLITNNGIRCYFSSFFDNIGGTLTHTENILDFFAGSARSITIGDSVGTVYNANTTTDVAKYLSTGVNGSFDKSSLVFKGINNTYDYDFGDGLETETPSLKCLFIPFVDDIELKSDAQSYGITTRSGTGSEVAQTFETTALNTPVANGDQSPTWIYREDYNYFVNNIYPNLTKSSAIFYSANGVNSRSDVNTIGQLGQTHLTLLRSIKGSSITFSELNLSTFLRHYDTNPFPGNQTFATLDALNDTGNNNYLTDNSDYTGYNNLQDKGFTTVLDMGEYTVGQGFIGNIDQDTFNSQITQAINEVK